MSCLACALRVLLGNEVKLELAELRRELILLPRQGLTVALKKRAASAERCKLAVAAFDLLAQ